MIALSQFNGLSKDEAVGLLAPCVAIPAWGETLVNLRPFASRHALLQTAREAMANWGEDELNAALSAHPRIGEKPTGSQAHAALSRQEQSSVDSENERLAQALREGLALCGGPLLLSLFPFLIVSTLLIQCPAADVLGLPFCPVARLIGVRAPAAGRVLLIGSLGGFAPAASAAAGAVRSGQLTAREADALLPACVCSGPSFVILAVGQSMLGSAELGVLLFLAQVAAGYLSAALLARLGGTLGSMAHPAVPTASQPLRLDGIIAQASQTYLKLCGFVLFFRMLAAGAGEVLPSGAGVFCAMLLEVCSGCDLAAKSGRFASMLCCAALSVQGLSVLMQVRTICPPEMTLRPLYRARLLHLPLSLLIFYLLLPQRAQETFSSLCGRVTTMRRLPPDCALLVFLGCCFVVCELSRVLAKELNQTQRDKVANQS